MPLVMFCRKQNTYLYGRIIANFSQQSSQVIIHTCGVRNVVVLGGLSAWKWLLDVMTCHGHRDTTWFHVFVCIDARLYVPQHLLSLLVQCNLLCEVVLICACIETLDTTMLELSLGPI